MPYINSGIKGSLEDGRLALQPGELNYLISTLIDGYIMRRGKSYGVLNEVIGALECAKLELYRRICGPYEDKKCSENGDVYMSAAL